MFIFPAVLLLQKKFIDLTVEENVNMARTGLIAVIVGALGIYLLVYRLIKSSNKKIWVPPKAQPSLLGPPPAPSPSEFIETTYYEHEVSVLKEGLSSMAMSCGIALFMSFKFNIHVSTIAQCLTVPYSLFESPVVRVRRAAFEI